VKKAGYILPRDHGIMHGMDSDMGDSKLKWQVRLCIGTRPKVILQDQHTTNDQYYLPDIIVLRVNSGDDGPMYVQYYVYQLD
jgi:hypothetical protein